MDSELLQFQQQGLAEGIAAWDHLVTITTSDDTETPETTLELRGVQSGVEVEPGDLEQFGFKVKRVFKLTVAGDRSAEVRPGMRGLEATTGETCRVLYHRKNRISTTFYFGTVNQ